MKIMKNYILLLIVILLMITGYYLLGKNIDKLITDANNISFETSKVINNGKTNDSSPLLKLSEDNDIDITKSYKISEKSSVSYTLIKKFLQKEHETIIGTSNIVQGYGSLDNENIANIIVQVDPKSFSTGVDKRDIDVKSYFTTDAIFIIKNLPISINNESFQLEVPGVLMINGYTLNLMFDVSGTLKDNELKAIGTTTAKISDFGITPPNLANIYTVDDEVNLSFDIIAIK